MWYFYFFLCIILQVLNREVTAIRRACSSLEADYKPMATFLVVQKWHHTRFFPTRKDEDGRNHNVPPGTVIDTKITHPIELDFFLVSHASLQVYSLNMIMFHWKLNWNDLIILDNSNNQCNQKKIVLFFDFVKFCSHNAGSYSLVIFKKCSPMLLSILLIMRFMIRPSTILTHYLNWTLYWTTSVISLDVYKYYSVKCY
jgi:hypothetical protein